MATLGPQASGRRVAALVVTYHADAELPRRLDRLIGQVDRLMVVDNGSPADRLVWIDELAGRPGVTILRNPANLGIATALNQGLRQLADEGFDWVFTSDQDSWAAPDCIAALLDVAAADPDPGGVALVGSNRRDDGTGEAPHRWLRPKRGFPFFERVACDRIGRDGVTLVITSGTLTSVAAWRRLGPFLDDLFIDFVDFEYALRARRAGYRILVAAGARIDHRVGAKRQARVLGATLSPTHHGPLRKYYLFRNGVHVIRSYGRDFPHWLIYQVLALVEVVVGVVIFETRKLAKLRACAVGLWDGLLGRKGLACRNF